jgi:diacylglycerol kinase family enzyme
MRVALVHNLDAGDRRYRKGELAQIFRDAGYEVEEFGKKRRQVQRAIDSSPDVLAVAGGDGTVAKGVKALAGSKTPLVIIPVGTANNIAQSLGFNIAEPLSVKALESPRKVRLDVGSIAAPWGETMFVEAAGIGFLGKLLRLELAAKARGERKKKTPSEKAIAGVARLVREQPVRFHDVRADEEDLSGEYLTLEAMNIHALGPQVVLAPDSEPDDGCFDLVLVRPEHRDQLARYVETSGTPDELPDLVIRRVRRATLSWHATDGHVDDKAWPRKSKKAALPADENRVNVAVSGSVNVLAPPL